MFCHVMAENDSSWFPGDHSWRKTTRHGETIRRRSGELPSSSRLRRTSCRTGLDALKCRWLGMILQSSKLWFTWLDNNPLWLLHFYQSCDYIYISQLRGTLWYFMISQLFKGAVLSRLFQYTCIWLIFGYPGRVLKIYKQDLLFEKGIILHTKVEGTT